MDALNNINLKIDSFNHSLEEVKTAKVWFDLNRNSGFNREDYKERPREMTPKQAAQLMVGKQKITILTGAGLSAASGIPTFRG